MAETELFTPKECAEYRRCSVRKLDRERAEGRGCAYIRIDGRIFYRRGDVDRFIGAHVCGPANSDIAVESLTVRSGRRRKHLEAVQTS